MSRRSRSDAEVQVEEYRNNAILLDKKTSKFVVQEIGDIAPVDTIQEARNAIDRHINESNKGVRRKVLFFGSRYRSDDEIRTIEEGELTSWTRRARGYRSLAGVVVSGRTRENMSPEDIFEDTPANRAAMARVIECDKAQVKAHNQAVRILEKEVTRAALPAHFTAE